VIGERDLHFVGFEDSRSVAIADYKITRIAELLPWR
jgi:hypothetical protein